MRTAHTFLRQLASILCHLRLILGSAGLPHDLPGRIRPGGSFMGVLLASTLIALPAWSAESFDLQHNDGLYTASADRVALSKVIKKISQMTDIPMSIAEGQDGPVTFVMEDVTIDDLIAGLSSSSMIVRRNIDGQDIIKEVVFMLGSDNNDVAAAALPSGQPADAIVVGTDAAPETTEAVVKTSSNADASASDAGSQKEKPAAAAPKEE